MTDTSKTEFMAFWAALNAELTRTIGKTVGFRVAQDAFMALGPNGWEAAARAVAKAHAEGETVWVDFEALDDPRREERLRREMEEACRIR